MIDIASGDLAAQVLESDRRCRRRHPFEALVAIRFFESDGLSDETKIFQARDISVGGLSVESAEQVESGTSGVMQIVRSNGHVALVGVAVRHTRAVNNDLYQIGLAFGPLPGGLRVEDFLDDSGGLPLFDPRLRDNAQN